MDSEHGTIANSAPLRLQRVKRLDPPNKPVHLEQIGNLQAQIDCLQKRIMEIKLILDNRAANRHVASPDLTAARKKLADLNSMFKEALERKRAHREELELVKEKLRGVGFRSGLPEVSVDELDEQIRKLEYRQTHTTMSIEEEKRLVVQIEKLKKSRDSLRRHDSRAEQDQGSRAELADLLKKDEQELTALKEEQEQQRRVLANIREKEAALAPDIPALLQEKNEAYEKIKGLRDDVKQLKAEFSAKEDEYWKREKEWRAQQALERKIKAERSREEWLEREKIRKQRALENFVEPYTDDIIMCDQLLSYMQKFAPLDEEAALPQSNQQKAEIIAPEGFGVTLVSKKNRNDDELDGWFAGSGGKKGKKAKGSSASKSKVRERISLSLDALTSFEKLKISAPVTYGDVTKSIEELKVRKSNFIEMQKKAKELREAGESGRLQGMNEVDAVDTVDDVLSAASNLHVSENYADADDNVEIENDSELKARNDTLGMAEYADAESSLKQKEPREEGRNDPVVDNVKGTEIAHPNDKAHLETFEFSDAQLHTEEEAHIEEQATESGVASVIFECATQSAASGENPQMEETPMQSLEDDDVYPHSGLVDNLTATVDETPKSPDVPQSPVGEKVKVGGSNGHVQGQENVRGLTPVISKDLATEFAKDLVL